MAKPNKETEVKVRSKVQQRKTGYITASNQLNWLVCRIENNPELYKRKVHEAIILTVALVLVDTGNYASMSTYPSLKYP